MKRYSVIGGTLLHPVREIYEDAEGPFVKFTEAEAAIAKARDDALEEAAKVCDGGPKFFGEAYAERIRALKGKPCES